jgi:hypothetical protein
MRIQVFFIGLAALVTVGLLAVWLSYSRVQFGYRISEMRVKQEALVQAKRSLEQEVSALRSAEAVERQILSLQLGLVYPSRTHPKSAVASVERSRP